MAVQNSCDPWETTDKVIYIACKPTETAGSDLTICPGSTSSFGGRIIGPSNPVSNTYSWSPSAGLSATNIPNPIAFPSGTTTYTLTVTNSSGCIATSKVTVFVLPLCTAHSATYCNKLCNGPCGANIGDGFPGVNYTWHIVSGTLSCTNCAKPLATAGRYYADYSLSYIDAEGHSNSCSNFCDNVNTLWTVSISCGPPIMTKGNGTPFNPTVLAATTNIYPNPFNSSFTAIYDGDGEVKIEVMDMLGKVLVTQQGNAKEEIKLSMNETPPGMYLIKITAEGNTMMKKIIKQ